MSESDQIESSSAVPDCPKCGGAMWDNREGKRNPKAPDFKCKDRSCDGVIWPPRGSTPAAGTGTAQPSAQRAPSGASAPPSGSAPSPATARAASARPAAAGSRVDSAGMPLCPICGGPMWDDRTSKRNPRAPDFKCRNKPRERGGPGCEGVIWPARDGSPSPYPPSAPRRAASVSQEAPPAWEGPPLDDRPPPDDDDLPF
jgi:hypothetical protein